MRGDRFFQQVGGRAPFSRMAPKVMSFFQEYLQHEKVISFQDRYVMNTHFPPYPSAAFDRMAEQFAAIGEVDSRRLFSVTLAVTNRCGYRCWHCYNAGRSQSDLPLSAFRSLAAELDRMQTVMVTLTGGEPLLRADLEEIAAAFGQGICLTLNTTGDGLTYERALRLRESGLFAVGVSLDSGDEQEHDRLRGMPGAFRTALAALNTAERAGLYPYIISVASRKLLEPERFYAFLRFARNAGAREVHLLEPCATGNLTGKHAAVLTEQERTTILEYQKSVATDDELPILSTFSYFESPEAFGCGAGVTYLYIDGSGEVCPCNLVPLSFGSVAHEPLPRILERMAMSLRKPRTHCIGQQLSRHIAGDRFPLSPEQSANLCQEHLPSVHAVPAFFRIRDEEPIRVGTEELKAAYNGIADFYETYWLSEARAPTASLIERLSLSGTERIFEAGCGTGYATAMIAGYLHSGGEIVAADISAGMLQRARERTAEIAPDSIVFACGDALQLLQESGTFDLIVSFWVLGYIPLAPFFRAAAGALKQGGRLAFVVHKENTPKEALELFGDLVARDPSVLLKQVSFDFPRDAAHLRHLLEQQGLVAETLTEGIITFRYDSAEGVMHHLLKSGAGTAFYEALDPGRRDALRAEFVSLLKNRHKDGMFTVSHDYLACIAGK